ncbi:hypothetical protein BDA99DRAFT_541978 [Phascolomyces articulosus]|uniref:Uncharacterized protein n=1 Tax=Phascolomyces articulosus TaxID=60185 RepID=A0AAD5JR43_9FUNG|nr:hypothetical protein BDA99DRAFT_541978 [Phascolomyces articulosus]
MPPKTYSVPKKQRSKNFTSVEDQQLCVLWNKNTNTPEGALSGLCPIGKADGYLRGVSAEKGQITQETNNKETASKLLTCLARDLNLQTLRLEGGVNTITPGAEAQEIYLVDALQLFEMTQGHEFQFEQCWSYLKDSKK